MSDTVETQTPQDTNQPEGVRKPWKVPVLMVSNVRDSQAHVTRFTDGTSPTHNIQYGS